MVDPLANIDWLALLRPLPLFAAAAFIAAGIAHLGEYIIKKTKV